MFPENWITYFIFLVNRGVTIHKFSVINCTIVCFISVDGYPSKFVFTFVICWPLSGVNRRDKSVDWLNNNNRLIENRRSDQLTDNRSVRPVSIIYYTQLDAPWILIEFHRILDSSKKTNVQCFSEIVFRLFNSSRVKQKKKRFCNFCLVLMIKQRDGKIVWYFDFHGVRFTSNCVYFRLVQRASVYAINLASWRIVLTSVYSLSWKERRFGKYGKRRSRMESQSEEKLLTREFVRNVVTRRMMMMIIRMTTIQATAAGKTIPLANPSRRINCLAIFSHFINGHSSFQSPAPLSFYIYLSLELFGRMIRAHQHFYLWISQVCSRKLNQQRDTPSNCLLGFIRRENSSFYKHKILFVYSRVQP